MNRQEIKIKLKEGLPTGYIKKIKALLAAKGCKCSDGKISQVCNPDLSDWDSEIIEAATELFEREKLREEKLTERIKDL
jgi:hypothetical protein